MTSGELKFALRVEAVLNTIPQPEYRQLVVEALMVLTLVVEHNLAPCLGDTLQVEQLVHTGNSIFLQDQVRVQQGELVVQYLTKSRYFFRGK
jgi:phosphorylase kinase alpha/beta subunit